MAAGGKVVGRPQRNDADGGGRLLARLKYAGGHRVHGPVATCRHDGLRHVVAAHLSRQNNSSALALAALRGALGAAGTRIAVADAAEGCGWIEIE